MMEIKNLRQYNQFNEKGVRVVEIVKGYVIVNNEYKCRLDNFRIEGNNVFIFNKKVSPRVAELFLQANKSI